MKKIASLALSLTFSFAAIFAQENQIPDWENPRVFAVNTEPTRATSIPYSSVETAVADRYESSPYYRSLNGIWDFKWYPRVGDVPKGFYADDFDASNWDKMPVPGNWEFNGFGTPVYINMNFGIVPKTPPFINREDSPTGLYRHTFDIPESWDGRRIFIHFENGTNSMYLWINGEKVGYIENAKSPAEFDITKYIRKGKNRIACEVHKFSDGTYLEDQDKWRLEGFNRNVYLYSTDQTRIQDFFVKQDLDSKYRNGIFSVDIQLKNYQGASQNQQISVSILDAKGKEVLKKYQSAKIPANGSRNVTLSGMIVNVAKWTAETPNLYTMVLELTDSAGKTIEATSCKIGFRKIEITDGQLQVNGKKVFMKGVNLHEYNAFDGNVVTREVMMRNIRLMKELNINAIRTSHYPQPTLFYKLCDEYGFYVVNEANIESHGLSFAEKNVSNFPEWDDAHMDRLIRTVERDKNHPSVITWSLGNEASNGPVYFKLYDWLKQRDASRPTQYEQASRKEERNTDIICPMYPSWEEMKRDAARDIGRPYIMCEYAHAMGNSMGNFQEYWDLMRSSKNMQGGFIWEWYNHGYPTKDEQGRFYWAYGGDLGGYNKMNHGNFCMDGIVTPDQQYMPHTHIVKKVYQDILFEAKDLDNGIITIINDFKFTDLTSDNYAFKWRILRNGKNFKEGDFSVMIPADTKKDITLNLPVLEKKAGVEYFLQVFAYLKKDTPVLEAGFEVAKEEFAMSVNDYFAPVKRDGNMQITREEGKAIVQSGSLKYEFSLKDGATLLSLTDNGEKVFKQLPRMNFWRAPIDNDFGSEEQYNLLLWNAANYNIIWKFKGETENGRISTFNYEGKLRAIDAKVFLSYTVDADGSLTMDVKYQALSDELPEMMRFGMLMSLPKDKNNFEWYGRGPWESYVDRYKDAFMGVWSGMVEDQAFPYYRPQETGNKMDVRWLMLKNDSGKGIRVDGAQPLSVSALKNLPEDFDPGTTKKQQHWSDILPLDEVVLCVDLFQRGVGGLDSWKTKPFEEYRFTDKEYSYSYTISFITD